MLDATVGASTNGHDRRPNAAAPIVAYGDGSIHRLPAHIAATGARRIMLVSGNRSFEASGAAKVLPALENLAVVERWSEFRPNTDATDLIEGLKVIRAAQPDLVLGVGGGSALDMAKLLVTFADADEDQVLNGIHNGFKSTTRRQGLYFVPTTSGSGAEATHFAVVYIGNDKYSIGGEGMRPDAIALDPRLTLSGSTYQRATSGIDAVSQAIESLWAVGATDRSRHFARVALRALMPAIEKFVNEPDDQSARAMAIGSHFAGRAIDISRTTAAHALSYGITKTYGISHGHAVSMTLGKFIEAHATTASERLQGSVQPESHAGAMADVLDALAAESAKDARARFESLLHRIGLDPSLAKAGATTPEHRTALADSVNVERLANNPVRFSAPQLAEIVNTM